MLEWAKGAVELSQGRPRRCHYGDDTDLFYRRNGTLYRVSPDFRQMDGSVDYDLIKAVIEYIIKAYSRKWGENSFWSRVAQLWLHFATQPDFLVDGTTVYRKRQKDGLMTGVVGTTLFDTAKSALAYRVFADAVHKQAKKGEYTLLEDPTEFFLGLGLEIKEGTWKPTEVLEVPMDGVLVSDNKFLGVQLVYRQGPRKVEPVPYLSEEDWMTLMMNPRDDPRPNTKSGISQIGMQRTQFDRCRGYMVTGMFTNPRMFALCESLINELPPIAILMAVQADGGKGEKPENQKICGEDFVWPTSEGVPDVKWCENIYFSEANRWEDAEWRTMFPQITDVLREIRRDHRRIRPVLKVGVDGGDVWTNQVQEEKLFISNQEKTQETQVTEYEGEVITVQREEEQDFSYPEVPAEMMVGDAPPPRLEGKINPRSKIVEAKGGVEKPLGKKMPTAQQVVLRKLAGEEVFQWGGVSAEFPAISVEKLADEMGRNVEALRSLVAQLPAVHESAGYLSLAPLPAPRISKLPRPPESWMAKESDPFLDILRQEPPQKGAVYKGFGSLVPPPKDYADPLVKEKGQAEEKACGRGEVFYNPDFDAIRSFVLDERFQLGINVHKEKEIHQEIQRLASIHGRELVFVYGQDKSTSDSLMNVVFRRTYGAAKDKHDDLVLISGRGNSKAELRPELMRVLYKEFNASSQPKQKRVKEKSAAASHSHALGLEMFRKGRGGWVRVGFITNKREWRLMDRSILQRSQPHLQFPMKRREGETWSVYRTRVLKWLVIAFDLNPKNLNKNIFKIEFIENEGDENSDNNQAKCASQTSSGISSAEEGSKTEN